MFSRVAGAWLWAGCLLGAQNTDAPLQRITARIREHLGRIPNYVCVQTINRSHRAGRDKPYRPADVVRVEVAVSGDKEIYGWPDGGELGEKQLFDMVSRGAVGTGAFAVLLKQVFAAGVAEFTAAGEEDVGGRRALRYDFAVPRAVSSYKVRVPPYEAVAGFSGSFWADARTFDLLRITAEAQDLPEQLGIAETTTTVDYVRVPISGADFLLPRNAELRITGLTGNESRNQSEFSKCREYQASSSLSFDVSGADRVQALAGELQLPPGTVLDLVLEAEINPQNAGAGEPVQAVLTRAIRLERAEIPEGSAVAGRIVAVEKRSSPIDHYIVQLQFHSVDAPAGRARFNATMVQAGPAQGLIKQEKRMNPVFDRRQRAPKLQVLVSEKQDGSGVLLWDARHPVIKKGLKMRWETGR